MDELHYQIDLLTALNHKLQEKNKMYQLISESSNNAYIYYNFKENHIEVLGSWKRFFNFTVEEVKDLLIMLDCVRQEDMDSVKELLFLEKTNQNRKNLECCLADNKTWLEIETTVLYESGEASAKTIRIRNITHNKSQQDELMYMAYYDTLTGLYNRNNYIRLLTEWINNASKSEIISVMFVDIDDFRKINDGMGMIVGDELVQLFAQFLKEFISEKVMISHFASDIFCIAIKDPCGTRSVDYIFNSIQERVTKPFLLSDRRELTISVSYGVAEYPEAAMNALELINYAEIVMFRSKFNNKGSIQYFNANILNDFLENVVLEHKLKEAVNARSFFVCFQPQYGTKTHTLRGVEALIRWRDTEGKLIGPGTFIPIAEKNNLIIPIGDWVIDESLRIYAEWKRKYRYTFLLSINISAVQYKRKDFVPKLLNAIKKYELSCKDIELEITESVLIDDFDDVTQKMLTLKDYGVKVSLDDFGTGFSSLSYLKGLPINALKIDKSFIDTITQDAASKIIVDTIVSMSKKLGFETIAEGVETREQYEYLKSIECEIIQGYLIGKPKTVEEMEALLNSQN